MKASKNIKKRISIMKINIKDLYELSKEFYGNEIPADSYLFQGEKIQELHKKVDDVYKVTLDTEVIYPSANHIMFDENDNEVKAKNLKKGDVLYNSVKVLDIELHKEQADVYDVSVDNETSTYELAGTKHHNTGNTKIQNLLRTILNGNIGCWDFDQVLDVEIYDNDFEEYVLKNIKG